ncbi:MAG: hypothetical protein PHC69_08240, partial [Ruminiclostridium sp.]|nr:hypothetical protein [Ruminiclostridium sp.]
EPMFLLYHDFERKSWYNYARAHVLFTKRYLNIRNNRTAGHPSMLLAGSYFYTFYILGYSYALTETSHQIRRRHIIPSCLREI